MEYLIVHRGGRGQSLVYELAFDGQTNEQTAHMMGLIDTNYLYDDQKLGQKTQKIVPSQGQVSPKLGSSQDSKITRKPSNSIVLDNKTSVLPKNAHLATKKNSTASHHTHVS